MGKRPLNTIKFRMGESTVEELARIYKYHVDTFEWSNDHEHLMGAHLADTYVRLERMERVMLKTATLEFNVSESLAFYQYWQITDTSAWPLATVLICDMLKKIDQRAKRNVYA